LKGRIPGIDTNGVKGTAFDFGAHSGPRHGNARTYDWHIGLLYLEAAGACFVGVTPVTLGLWTACLRARQKHDVGTVW